MRCGCDEWRVSAVLHRAVREAIPFAHGGDALPGMRAGQEGQAWEGGCASDGVQSQDGQPACAGRRRRPACQVGTQRLHGAFVAQRDAGRRGGRAARVVGGGPSSRSAQGEFHECCEDEAGGEGALAEEVELTRPELLVLFGVFVFILDLGLVLFASAKALPTCHMACVFAPGFHSLSLLRNAMAPSIAESAGKIALIPIPHATATSAS